MNKNFSLVAAAVLVVLALAKWWVFLSTPPEKAPSAPPAKPHAPIVYSFTSRQLNTFMASAKAAEAMTDPLQRCLAFPDPPDSHWSRAAVEAYCQYMTQPYLDVARVKAMVAGGHAGKLDRELADAMHKQESESASRGLLDKIYLHDFNDQPAELRATLDEWKRQSPRSAFAYAASGTLYVDAAGTARGTAFVNETPASNIEAMQAQLALAKADLATAARLDPGVTPTYQAMIFAARMDGDDNDMAAAVAAGLRASPLDYDLYEDLMDSAKPKWGGSLDAMRKVAAQAQAGVKDNPLLELILPEPDAYDSGICGCGTTNYWTEGKYTQVLDRIAGNGTLAGAGRNAREGGDSEFSLVYLSEALRFDPGLKNTRMLRLDVMGTLSLDSETHDTFGRAFQAEAERIIATAPTDSDVLGQVGQAYGNQAQWDNAWNVADQLIKSFPDKPDGWILRAMVQEEQPRPGLHDTATYIVEHFADNPDAQPAVARARMDLAKEEHH